MQLPSRAQFLANGLVPVTVDSDFECSISLDSTDDAVELPCHHKFDRESITAYLNSAQAHKCPMCRRDLFVPPEAELLRPNADRHALVSQAVRRSGLAFDDVTPNLYVFGFSPSDTEMHHGTPSAQQYLIQTPVPAFGTATGPALIELSHLRGRIVAMGNLLPAIAAITGREYTREQLANWITIVNDLSNTLQIRDGETVEATQLPRQLRASLLADARRHWRTIDQVDFFAEEGTPTGEDLYTLISYVTECCVNDFNEQAQRERSRVRAARAAPQRNSEKKSKHRLSGMLSKDGDCSVM